MDVERLINLIYNERALWDQKIKNYNNRDVSRNLWSKVGSEMNISSAAAKAKWKNLRDTFRREYQKIKHKNKTSTGGERITTSWPYYQNLMFLSDQMIPRTTGGNNLESSFIDYKPDPDDNSIKNEHIEYEENVVSEFCEIGELPDTGSESLNFSNDNDNISNYKRNRKRKHDMKDKLLEVELEKLNFLKRKYSETFSTSLEQDSDHQFLSSLLPFLKNISPSRKMTVRMKLQQVFLEEEQIASEASISSIDNSQIRKDLEIV